MLGIKHKTQVYKCLHLTFYMGREVQSHSKASNMLAHSKYMCYSEHPHFRRLAHNVMQKLSNKLTPTAYAGNHSSLLLNPFKTSEFGNLTQYPEYPVSDKPVFTVWRKTGWFWSGGSRGPFGFRTWKRVRSSVSGRLWASPSSSSIGDKSAVSQISCQREILKLGRFSIPFKAKEIV